MKAIGIVGWKNSGKTTLIARLIPELIARGLSVSTVKHVHHEVDLDEPGKDTYVHRAAGAVDVAMLSDSRWAVMHERRPGGHSLAELQGLFDQMTPVDLVLVEGFKSFAMPKIDVRSARTATPAEPVVDHDVIAIVSDGGIDSTVPNFNHDDLEGLADFIVEFVGTRVNAPIPLRVVR